MLFARICKSFQDKSNINSCKNRHKVWNLILTRNFTFNTTKQCFWILLIAILRLLYNEDFNNKWLLYNEGVFQHWILSKFQLWSSTALNTLINYSIKASNNNNIIRISCVFPVVFVAYFSVNSKGCFNKFRDDFEHFDRETNYSLEGCFKLEIV